MKKVTTIMTSMSLAAFLVGCNDKKDSNAHGHDHDSDHSHQEEKVSADKGDNHDDHDHGEEAELGEFDIQGHKVKALQSHGKVEAGKEGHLVIVLPYNDKGESVVRAWIGSEDRTLSSVGKGEYASSHDDYDIHMMAPDPLPANAKWWLEIEKPDGTKAVGSIPLLKDIKK